MALHGDGIKELLVHVHPGHDGKILRDVFAKFLPELGRSVGVACPHGHPVYGATESVEFLTDMKGNQQELAVVKIAPAFEDAADGQFGRKHHLTQGVDIPLGRFGIPGGLLLQAVELLENLTHIAR